jgi:hypothetical protein
MSDANDPQDRMSEANIRQELAKLHQELELDGTAWRSNVSDTAALEVFVMEFAAPGTSTMASTSDNFTHPRLEKKPKGQAHVGHQFTRFVIPASAMIVVVALLGIILMQMRAGNHGSSSHVGNSARTTPAATQTSAVTPTIGSNGTATPTAGKGSTTTPTIPTGPLPKVAVYTATADSTGKPNNQVSTSVSCKSGEQMIGGGFAASDVFEYAAFVSASYPSGPNTWTVAGSSISHFQLTAEVYCLQEHASVGVQISQHTGQGNAVCPAGSVVLSGGGQTTNQELSASQPYQQGWSVTGQSVQAYALCATRDVVLGKLVSVTLSVHSSTNGQQPESAQAVCPAGEITTGGGFSGGGTTMQSAASSFSRWTVTAGGDFTETITAICTVIH